jgi:hypothetical protein
MSTKHFLENGLNYAHVFFTSEIPNTIKHNPVLIVCGSKKKQFYSHNDFSVNFFSLSSKNVIILNQKYI